MVVGGGPGRSFETTLRFALTGEACLTVGTGIEPDAELAGVIVAVLMVLFLGLGVGLVRPAPVVVLVARVRPLPTGTRPVPSLAPPTLPNRKGGLTGGALTGEVVVVAVAGDECEWAEPWEDDRLRESNLDLAVPGAGAAPDGDSADEAGERSREVLEASVLLREGDKGVVVVEVDEAAIPAGSATIPC